MKISTTAMAAAAALVMAACSQPSEAPPPAPAEPVAPATPTVSANPSLSPEGQPLEQAISCSEERGAATAQRLVERCIAVSPATRPPCNVQNPCEMIESEIKRGCDMFGAGDTKPAECAA